MHSSDPHVEYRPPSSSFHSIFDGTEALRAGELQPKRPDPSLAGVR